MMELDRKKLIIIAIVLASILFGTLLYMFLTYERVLDKKDEKQSNIYEVQNNNSFVVKYGDYIYYVPENKSAYSKNRSYYINRFLEKNTDDEIVGEATFAMKSLKISPNLTIYNNRLLAVQDYNTYKIELSNGTMYSFCNGTLQYINDDSALILAEGDLYAVPYFEKTFLPKKYQKIVDGNCVYLYEDDDALYYYSTDDLKKVTVFSISKENLNFTNLFELDPNTGIVNQLVSNNKYIYCLISGDSTRYINRINKKNNNADNVDLSAYTDLYMFVLNKKNDIYFYASKNYGEIKSYVCKENADRIDEYNDDVKNEYIQRYSIEINDGLLRLYKDKLFFAEFSVDANNLTVAKINDIAQINDFIYYKIYYTNMKASNNLEFTRGYSETDSTSGDAEEIISKTIIVRVSTDGKIVQKLK